MAVVTDLDGTVVPVGSDGSDIDAKTVDCVRIANDAGLRIACATGRSWPEVNVPDALVDRLDDDPDAGVEHALDLVAQLEQSGVYDGVHLIPVTRVAQVAERLRH